MILYELLLLVGIIPMAEFMIAPFLVAGPVFIALWLGRIRLALPRSASMILIIGGVSLTYFMTLTTLVYWIID